MIHVNASDPDNDPLTYSFSATGGRLETSGPDSRWLSAGLLPGNYTVTAKIDDGRGGTAACSVDIRVLPRHGPPQADGHPPSRDGAPAPPPLRISADRSVILTGESVTLTAASVPGVASAAYRWSASAGRIIGAGSTVQFDSSGLAPGVYVIKVSAADAAGHESVGSVSIDVVAPSPPPPPPSIGTNPPPHPVAAKPPMTGQPHATGSLKSSGFASQSQTPPSQVSTGNVAFQSEDTMELGNSYPVIVLVSATVSKAELQQNLEQQLRKTRPDTQKKNAEQGKTTSEEIKSRRRCARTFLPISTNSPSLLPLRKIRTPHSSR